MNNAAQSLSDGGSLTWGQSSGKREFPRQIVDDGYASSMVAFGLQQVRHVWCGVVSVVVGSLWATVLADTAEFQELQRFRSQDAHQGVGVGAEYVYAVGSRSITQHDKLTGTVLRRWEASGKEWIHLDSAVVVGDRLFCAHSNFPLLPMTGSVEVYDATTLEWVSRRVWEDPPGSFTWLDWYDGSWWACFAHYNGFGGYPDKDHSLTTLVRYSSDWNELGRWRFPSEVLRRFGRYSCSGGSWVDGDRLFCTGHDAAEVYVMSLPRVGEELVLNRILELNAYGQGIAFDRTEKGRSVLYSIKRRSREVVISVLRE